MKDTAAVPFTLVFKADPKISVKNGSKFMVQSVYSTGWDA
jgi:hypothetical protein